MKKESVMVGYDEIEMNSLEAPKRSVVILNYHQST